MGLLAYDNYITHPETVLAFEDASLSSFPVENLSDERLTVLWMTNTYDVVPGGNQRWLRATFVQPMWCHVVGLLAYNNLFVDEVRCKLSGSLQHTETPLPQPEVSWLPSTRWVVLDTPILADQVELEITIPEHTAFAGHWWVSTALDAQFNAGWRIGVDDPSVVNTSQGGGHSGAQLLPRRTLEANVELLDLQATWDGTQSVFTAYASRGTHKPVVAMPLTTNPWLRRQTAIYGRLEAPLELVHQTANRWRSNLRVGEDRIRIASLL